MIIRLLSIIAILHLATAEDCPRYHPNPGDPATFVCECSSAACADAVTPVLFEDLNERSALLYRTSLSGDRLARHPLEIKAWTREADSDALVFAVNRSVRFQKIHGFGGAMTDAAAINIDKLVKEEDRQRLLQQYFGEHGIGYTILRIPMASCDFSTREYSYVEQEGDFELKSFALVEEDEQKARHAKKAIELVREEGRKMKVFASPWSAPAWMKTNGHMKGGGSLKPGAEYIRAWADYFVKFIEAYTAAGVPIWAVTTQNEPSTGREPGYSFQTMYLGPEDQASFVRNILVPAFNRSGVARGTEIMIFDDFRGNLPHWPDITLADPATASLISGIAYHWYGNSAPVTNLDKTHDHHPNHWILATEACFTDSHGVTLGNFTRGMLYAKDVVEDLNHWVTGWVDWNVALDQQGGPNWVGNFVDSPIIVDAEKQLFYKQPMFYALGQFSRFISPGAVRIGLSGPTRKNLDTVAFKNPDSSIAIVLLNYDDEAVYDVEIRDRTASIPLKLEPQSINTVVYRIGKDGRPKQPEIRSNRVDDQ